MAQSSLQLASRKSSYFCWCFSDIRVPEPSAISLLLTVEAVNKNFSKLFKRGLASVKWYGLVHILSVFMILE